LRLIGVVHDFHGLNLAGLSTGFLFLLKLNKL
jgi:hypothetical protein